MKNEYKYIFQGKEYTRNQLEKKLETSAFYKKLNFADTKTHSNIISTNKGYIYTIKFGEYKGEQVQIIKKKITQNYCNIDKFIYTLDIETSTFYNEKNIDWNYQIIKNNREIRRLNNKFPISIPYLIGIKQYEFDKIYNASNNELQIEFAENNFYNYFPLRSYDDCICFFKDMIENSYYNNTVKFIIIQNNSYEDSFLHSNVYVKLAEDANIKIEYNYIKPHKPMKIDISYKNELCIRILDSYLLTSQSLKTYGNTYGIEKLDKNDNYKSFFTPLTNLSNDEYIYNKRDLDITILMFINTLKNLAVFCNKKPQELISRVYTKTGLTRIKNKQMFENGKINIKYNKNDMSKDNLNHFVRVFENCKGDTELVPLYQFNSSCFIGGYVRANENSVYEIKENVKSIDITSSYPYSMKSKFFGFNYIVDKSIDSLLFLKKWKKKFDSLNFDKLLDLYFSNRLIYYLSYKYPMFNCSIIIKDLKAKKLNNKNSMLIMSYSKLIDSINCKAINGRVKKADYCCINVSSIELINYLLIYDFDIIDVSYFEVATIVEKLPYTYQNTIDYYYTRKNELKQIIKMYNNNTLSDYLNTIEKTTLNNNELNYIKDNIDNEEIEIFLNQLLMISKADLNAQFGINVENPNHDIISITDNNIFEVTKNDVENSIIRRNYKVGINITAWSRMHLILMSLLLIQNGAIIHYWDTDSIKFTSNNDDIENIIEEFNLKVGKIKKCPEIGCFTFEYQNKKNYSYDYFITLGSKNYWTVSNNKISYTVSGLSGKAKELITNYFNQCNSFDDFVKNALRPRTIYDGESIKSSLTDYTSNIIYQDIVINNYHFKGYSGVIINQPQSRALLPYPTMSIENKYYKIYKKISAPQLIQFDNDKKAIIRQINDKNSLEIKGLK